MTLQKPNNASVVIPAQTMYTTMIGIPIVDDAADEPDEYFEVVLSLPNDSPAELGVTDAAIVKIVDNDETPNTPPVADSQSVSTTQSIAKPILLTGSDVDAGDTLTYTITAQPAHGLLSGTPPTVLYTPNLDFVGGDEFKFKVNDGTEDSPEATVTINVVSALPLNLPPVAVPEAVNVPGATIPITLKGIDANGDTLTYIIVTPPSNGVLSGTPPTLIYTPTPGFEGGDSFTFKVNDGTVDSPVAGVSIQVSNNPAPSTMKSIYLPFVSKK